MSREISIENPLLEWEQDKLDSIIKNEKITKDNVEEKIIELENQSEYALALELVRRFRAPFMTVTKKTLKQDYRLRNAEIEQMSFLAVKNPYYSCAGPMKLYLKSEAKKWVQEILNH